MKDTFALRCVRNGTKLLYGFTIQSLSTSGHKGSFIGIMFVLHSCCVLTAFTTTSETVYWYNVGRDFRHARCRFWYCRRRYGSERPEVSLFPVNYLISCWKDAVKVLPWNGASQPWQHPSSKIMSTYRWRWETRVASFSRSRAAPNWNASIPAWLMPSAQIRMSRIYVVDSKFTKYLPPWCILLLHDVSVATISETASGVAKNPVRFHYIQCLRKRRWISHSVQIK